MNKLKTLAELAKIDGLHDDALDSLIHDLKSSEASNLNNEGRCAQVDYIYEAMGKDAHNAIMEEVSDDAE